MKRFYIKLDDCQEVHFQEYNNHLTGHLVYFLNPAAGCDKNEPRDVRSQVLPSLPENTWR